MVVFLFLYFLFLFFYKNIFLIWKFTGIYPGRPAAGQPPPPALYKGLAAPPTLICPTKNPEKKKREGGRERRGEGEVKRQSSVRFSSRRLQVTKIFYTLQIYYIIIIFVDTVD